MLHVIETMSPREGGPPRVVAGLAAAQRSMGLDAHILCDDGQSLTPYMHYWETHVAGFSSQYVHSIPGRPANAVARGLALHRWLSQYLRAYDVVHVHQLWRLVPTLTGMACHRLRVPYLIAPHTSLSNWALSQKWAKKALARSLVWNRIFGAASGFHALNDLEAAEIRENVGPRSPPVFVVPNGVSLAEFAAEPVDQVPAFAAGRVSKPGGERPFVLFLARLHIMKGPDLLLDGFASAALERPELQLVFAGPDFGMQEGLQRHAAELGLADRIHFFGLVAGPERLWLLQHAVCLAQPSRDEGFSLSILEAMACGRPVVISDRCKFPDVAREGAGVIVPLSIVDIAAALRAYASDPARRMADGGSARRLIQRSYTWDIVCRQADQMYSQVIGSMQR